MDFQSAICQEKELFTYEAFLDKSAFLAELERSRNDSAPDEKKQNALLGLWFVIDELANTPVLTYRVFKTRDSLWFDYRQAESQIHPDINMKGKEDGRSYELPVKGPLHEINHFLIQQPNLDKTALDTLRFYNTGETSMVEGVECYKYLTSDHSGNGPLIEVFMPAGNDHGISPAYKFPLSVIPIGLPEDQPILKYKVGNYFWRLKRE